MNVSTAPCLLPVKAFSSAYPGSMHDSADGDYINRFDATSLAGALLEEITRLKRNLEDVEQEMAFCRAAMAPAERAIIAKPLEWDDADDRAPVSDKHFGFWIDKNDEKDRLPFVAGWGEGDTEDFATLDEAKAWCQTKAQQSIDDTAMLATDQEPKP